MPTRQEFRVAARELVIFGAAFVLICALTFVFGVLVGRELARSSPPRTATAAAEKPAGPPPPAPDEGREVAAKSGERGVSEERLTFYKTLTAPTPEPSPPPPRPRTVEERIVPHELPARAPLPEARRASGLAAEAGPARPAAPPAAAARATETATPKRLAGAVASRTAAAATAAAPDPTATSPRPWTVQVSSFRSRTLAEELTGQLQAKGFDAYLVRVSTDEGRVWHRVRVGGYSTRAEAERVASELRGERNLNPVVTSRTR